MSTDTPTPRVIQIETITLKDGGKVDAILDTDKVQRLAAELTAANTRHAALLKRLEILCEQWEESARKQAILKSGGLYLFTAKELRAAITP